MQGVPTAVTTVRSGQGDGPDLLIFDCDGVVIDSEIISARTLVELLARWGVMIDLAYTRVHFLGRSFPTVSGIVQRQFGVVLPEDFETSYRRILLERFETELRPMPGVEALLASLSMPYCLATSSSPPRARRSLELTGLLPFFEGLIFTASQVPRGKPAPDLFLHAAATFGVAPARCLVIEDSPVGLEAAHTAGMQVAWFAGGAHLRGWTPTAEMAEGQPLAPHYRFDALSDLPRLLPSVTDVSRRQPHGT